LLAIRVEAGEVFPLEASRLGLAVLLGAVEGASFVPNLTGYFRYPWFSSRVSTLRRVWGLVDYLSEEEVKLG
jgi:hypothetical protein